MYLLTTVVYNTCAFLMLQNSKACPVLVDGACPAAIVEIALRSYLCCASELLGIFNDSSWDICYLYKKCKKKKKKMPWIHDRPYGYVRCRTLSWPELFLTMHQNLTLQCQAHFKNRTANSNIQERLNWEFRNCEKMFRGLKRMIACNRGHQTTP